MPVETSQPPPKVEMSKEERKRFLLSKVRVRRENLLAGSRVEGRADKEYCWVNQREERQLFFQAMGWELVKDKEVKSSYMRPDGTHVRADLILYQIDKDMYEAIQADRELRSIEALEGVEEGFQTSANRQGAPTFRPRA